MLSNNAPHLIDEVNFFYHVRYHVTRYHVTQSIMLEWRPKRVHGEYNEQIWSTTVILKGD